MKNIFNFYKPVAFTFVILLSFVACDRDFTSIESDIEGIRNFENNSRTFPLITYNKKLNPVKTNGLSSNLFGIYTDPIFGTTKGSVVSQIVPTSFDFNFGENPEIDSVIMIVPYYSKNIGTDDDGNKLYELDSVFGDDIVKLSVYQNNYFLRDFDPETNLEQGQRYYSNSNQTIDFDSHTGELLYYNEDFKPSSLELNINDEQIAPPGIHVRLLNTNNSN